MEEKGTKKKIERRNRRIKKKSRKKGEEEKKKPDVGTHEVKEEGRVGFELFHSTSNIFCPPWIRVFITLQGMTMLKPPGCRT